MYAEFNRLERDSPWGEKGLGLGLSICDRLGQLLAHPLTFTSHPGRGSVFGVRVPRDARPRRLRRIDASSPVADPIGLRGLRVLCVDNDRSILDGMEALLSQWGVHVMKATGSAEAMQCCAQQVVDAVLADYHLGDGVDGIELLRRLHASRLRPTASALISADHDAGLALIARTAGYPLLYKPLRPAALRALLSAFRGRPDKASAA
jgi:CheY-like chemotaxis protein